ncbi:hypothetical protein OHU34_38295 [Streptomyces sp. NBC_00080]|uniref:hypothetical protein n=1 Tax=Streptomyces sp. NBC_00080 TaxID=2975645 RepID=UPI003253AD00
MVRLDVLEPHAQVVAFRHLLSGHQVGRSACTSTSRCDTAAASPSGWQNSAGALKEGNGWDGTPDDGRRALDRLGQLPATDLHLATASTANYTNNGLRDLNHYQGARSTRASLCPTT